MLRHFLVALPTSMSTLKNDTPMTGEPVHSSPRSPFGETTNPGYWSVVIDFCARYQPGSVAAWKNWTEKNRAEDGIRYTTRQKEEDAVSHGTPLERSHSPNDSEGLIARV
jgi:hypothetical protein